jgi:tetrahydromethanopterin S-methyltransferase subunit G
VSQKQRIKKHLDKIQELLPANTQEVWLKLFPYLPTPNCCSQRYILDHAEYEAIKKALESIKKKLDNK